MSADRLHALFRACSQLTLGTELVRAVGLALACLLLTALGLIYLDGLLGLPASGLVVLDLLWLTAALAAAVWGIRRLIRLSFDPRRVARTLESHLAIDDNRLINAVELEAGASPGASRLLVEQTVARGEAAADRLSAAETVSWRPLWRGLGAAVAGVALVAAACWLTPRLMAAVASRLLDPWGDHPPYTLLSFEVATEPRTLYYGKPAAIAVRLSGPVLPDRASVVFVHDGRLEAADMLRGGAGEFRLPLDSVTQSQTFFIATPEGRSRRHLLPVVQVPLLESAEVRYRFPAYTGWPQQQSPLDARGLRALAGTEIELTVESNVPLSEGILELTPLAAPPKPSNATSAAEGVPPGDTGTPGDTLPSGQSRTPVPTLPADSAAAKSPPPPQPQQVRLLPVAGQERQVAGRFPLSFSGRYSLRLVSRSRVESLETWSGPLVAAVDRPPQVDLLSPPHHLLAVENWVVPVVVQAADDVAVESMELQAAVNGWGPHPLALTESELASEAQQPGKPGTGGSANRRRAECSLDLGQLGAVPGDLITCFATAWDNRQPQSQASTTSLHVIEVISAAEYAELARNRFRMEQMLSELADSREQLEGLRKQREAALDALEQLQKKARDGQPLTPEEKLQLEELQRQLRDLASASRQLSEQFRERSQRPPLYDFEPQYLEKYRSLAEQLAEQAQVADQAAGDLHGLLNEPGEPSLRERLEELERKLAENADPLDQETQKKLERTREELETLRLADSMLDQANRLEQIVDAQRELAEQLGQFRNQPQLRPDQQGTAQRLSRQQEQLRQELDQAVEQLRQTAQQAQDKLPKTSADAQQLCDQIGQLGISQDQGTAADSARGGAGKKAHQAADSAAEKLESLVSNAPSEGEVGEDGDLDRGLGLSREQFKRSLRQLGQSRGPGQRPMSGRGQGQGQGQSRSRVAVAGPHLPNPQRLTGRPMSGQDLSALGAGFGDAGEGELPAEQIAAEANSTGRSGAGNLRGVPAGYRDQAEAYFRRLAEEK